MQNNPAKTKVLLIILKKYRTSSEGLSIVLKPTANTKNRMNMGASDELFVAVTDSERTNFTVIDFVG